MRLPVRPGLVGSSLRVPDPMQSLPEPAVSPLLVDLLELGVPVAESPEGSPHTREDER